MPTRDFIVKLAGDSKSYQSAMSEADKALSKFGKQNLSTDAAMKTLTSALAKYISIAALAKGAQEALTAVIKGSQTSADEFAAGIDGCKTAISTFFTALSTGDFSSFTQGLDQIILKGAQASRAMDQLGNTVMSFNYLTASNNAAFNESLLTMRNANATPAQRAAARKEAEKQLEYAQDLAAGKEAALIDAITKNAVKKSPLRANMFNVEDIQKISLLDALSARPDLLESYGLQSKDYYLAQAQEYSQLIKAARPTMEAIPGDLYRSEAGRTQAAEIEARNRAAQAAFNTYEAALQKEYQFALEVKALLEDISDEELKTNIFDLSTDVANTKQGVTQMQRQLLAAAGELKRGDGGTGTGTTSTSKNKKSSGPKMMTDLEYERMMYQERLKLAEEWSDEYIGLQMELRETEHKIQVERLTATIQDEEKLTEALKLAEENKNKDLYNIAMEGYAQRLKMREDYAKSLEKIKDDTKEMSSMFDSIKEGGRSLEYLGRAMEQLSEKDGWKGVGNLVAGVGSAVSAYMQLATAAQTAAAAQAAAETPTIWGKLAAITALVAAFGTAASQLKSLQNYAEGGVIPGQNWNDGITARVSSGEMIINEADQKRLYDSIHSGNMGGGGGPAVITGEQIVLAVNNYGRRTNQGELVFAGR